MKKVLFFSLVAMFSFASLVTAETVTVSLDSYNNKSITATITGIGSKNYLGGVMQLGNTEESAFIGATTFQGKVAAFCIDLAETVGGTNTFGRFDDISQAPKVNGSDPYWEAMGANKAQAMKQLWKIAMPAVILANASNSVASSAMQIALHEILFEGDGTTQMYGSWNLALGDYAVTNDGQSGAAVTLAQGWLNSLTNSSAQANLAALVVPSQGAPGAVQDLLYEVPSPSALVGLIGLGLTGVCVRFRRQRRS